MAAMTEIQKLIKRWRKKTGNEMPIAIMLLPLDKIRRAVELTEKGITVAVPTDIAPRLREQREESMMMWDKHGEFT